MLVTQTTKNVLHISTGKLFILRDIAEHSSYVFDLPRKLIRQSGSRCAKQNAKRQNLKKVKFIYKTVTFCHFLTKVRNENQFATFKLRPLNKTQAERTTNHN